MEQPIIGRIEQLTFIPHNQKKPDDSGQDFFKRQKELNDNLLKSLLALAERFNKAGASIDNNFRTLSASIAAVWTILVEKGLTTPEEFDELTEIAAQTIDEKRGAFMDKQFTGVDREEFERLVKPLVDFLQTKCHPHMSVIVEWDRATLVEDRLGVGFKVPD